jgi:hypothetical protein
VNALISNIEQAFDDVRYPGDEDLTESTYGEELASLVEEFSGKDDWRLLDTEFLDQAPDGWASALSFFSKNALRFYLPAYLIADIRGHLNSQDPAYRLCLSVTPLGGKQKIAKIYGGSTMGERARAEFDSYDKQKVSVIVDYLWWKLDMLGGHDETIEQALENYWLQRNDGK